MKWGKIRNIRSVKVIRVLIAFIFLFSLVFSFGASFVNSDIGGNWYYDSSKRFIGYSSSGILDVRVDPINSTRGLNGQMTLNYFKINGISYNVTLYSLLFDYTNINKVWGVEFRNVPINVNLNDIIEFSISYNGTQTLQNSTTSVSGTLYFNAKRSATNLDYGWFVWDLQKATFNLIYNNDYNYTSNTASFTMQYSNFSFNYFSYLNTDVPGGFSIHLQTYNITQSGSTYVVHCTFDNNYVNLSNPHYLFWTVHGLDNNGNPMDLSGSTSFNLTTTTAPVVPKGVLVITSPQTGDNFASGTTQIPISVAYGGDVTNVTDPNYNHTSVTVGAVKALHNAGSVDLTSYSIINGTTIWSGTLTLNSGEGDGEYTLMANLDGTTLMSDTVTITIGSTTGNPVLDFLKAVWAEFKDWFVNTMKALFVPNATDFSSQIAQGWVQVSNPLPSVTPQYTIDIPMSKALGTQNGVATIDFKTPITSWSGYPTMQSVIRVGLYTLLIFLIWSMVT